MSAADDDDHSWPPPATNSTQPYIGNTSANTIEGDEGQMLLGESNTSRQRHLKCFKYFLYILCGMIVLSVPILLYFYIPRSPVLTLDSFRIVEFTQEPTWQIVIEDNWTVSNRNYFEIVLQIFEYTLYFENTGVGRGSNTQEYTYASQSEGPLVTRKVLSEPDDPILAQIREQCQTRGYFVLATKYESYWKILLSTQYLVSYRYAEYLCE